MILATTHLMYPYLVGAFIAVFVVAELAVPVGGTLTPLISGPRTSLSEYIAQAQQAQPEALKPESGIDLERAAEVAAHARAAERAAMVQFADAARLAVSAGMSENQAAKTAGVSRTTIRKWVAQ